MGGRVAMVFLVPLVCVSVAFGRADSGAAVTEAYRMRMAGRADEAKAALQMYIADYPNDSIAHYELARAYHHMGLGKPVRLENMLERAQFHIERAVEIDDKNVPLRTFCGQVAVMGAYYQTYSNRDKPAARAQFIKACKSFTEAVRLKPDYKQGLLYLVELYGGLPDDLGGDQKLAREYADRLKGLDPVYSARAEAILDQKDVAFWEEVVEANPGNADAMESLGKAHLAAQEPNEATTCFGKAIQADRSKTYLLLDLGTYHTFAAMRAGPDKELRDASVAAGDKAISTYIALKPSGPLQAYALGVRSKFTVMSGDRQAGHELYKKAEELDSHFSKATGCPNLDLFITPGTLSRTHRFLTRPF